MVDSLEQGPGQRAFARTNLDDGVAGRRVNGVDDSLQYPGVVQEVLAKTLARFHGARLRGLTGPPGASRRKCGRAAGAATPGRPRPPYAPSAPGAPASAAGPGSAPRHAARAPARCASRRAAW